jgi:hypothetical protein
MIFGFVATAVCPAAMIAGGDAQTFDDEIAIDVCGFERQTGEVAELADRARRCGR